MMRAETIGLARVSTITPPSRVDAMSPFKVPGYGERSHLEFYALRTGEALALVAFLSFWTAGQLALEGHATDAYQRVPHFLRQMAVHRDPDWPYLAFFYPPFFLL